MYTLRFAAKFVKNKREGDVNVNRIVMQVLSNEWKSSLLIDANFDIILGKVFTRHWKIASEQLKTRSTIIRFSSP